MKIFGVNIQQPAAYMFNEPATQAQLDVIEKQREWRSATPAFFKQIIAEIWSEAGWIQSDPKGLSKGEASILIDWFINAPGATKTAVEKRIIARAAEQDGAVEGRSD